MEPSFWHERWQNANTPFHERVVNPLIERYFPELRLAVGSRVFVPLCGRTLDIGWLLGQGYRVAGAELSKIGITQLFAQLAEQFPERFAAPPRITALEQHQHYAAPGVDIFVGDIFALTAGQLGPVDAIYDRAAIVALPPEMRDRYTAHLMRITARAPQLLLSFEYDQSLMPGPPFAVSPEEIARQYSADYSLTHLTRQEVPGGLKGIAATESAWLLARPGAK
jgi:thiopurine S-methyltransferase